MKKRQGNGELAVYTISHAFFIAFVLLWLSSLPLMAQTQITQEPTPAGVTFSYATNNLFNAVRRKDLKAVEAAIKAGADIYATNRKGTSTVGLAVDQGFFEISKFLLQIRSMRDEQTADITFSPATINLFNAVRRKDLKAVKAAIEADADIYATNRKGMSAVGLAVDQGFFEISKFLLRIRGIRDEQTAQASDKHKGPWAPKVTLATPQVADVSPQVTKPTVAASQPPPTDKLNLTQTILVPLPPRNNTSERKELMPPRPAPKPKPQQPHSLTPPSVKFPIPPSETIEHAYLNNLPKINLPDFTEEVPSSFKSKDYSIPLIKNTIKPEDPTRGPIFANASQEEEPPQLSLKVLRAPAIETNVIDRPSEATYKPKSEETFVEGAGVTKANRTRNLNQIQQPIPLSSASLIRKLHSSISKLTSDFVKETDSVDKKQTSGLINKFKNSFNQFTKHYIQERGSSEANELGITGLFISDLREAYLLLIRGAAEADVTRKDKPIKSPELTETSSILPKAKPKLSKTSNNATLVIPSSSEPEANIKLADEPSRKYSEKPSTFSQESSLKKMQLKILNTWRFFMGSSEPSKKLASQQAPTELVQKQNSARTLTSPSAPTEFVPPLTEERIISSKETKEHFEELTSMSLPGFPELPELGETNGLGAFTKVPLPKDKLAFLPLPKGFEHLAKPVESSDGDKASAQTSSAPKTLEKEPTLEQQLDQAFKIPGIVRVIPKTIVPPKKIDLDAQLDEVSKILALDQLESEGSSKISTLPGVAPIQRPSTKRVEVLKKRDKYTTIGPGPASPRPIGAQSQKAGGDLIDRIIELVKPDELSAIPDNSTRLIDNADETGWGVKKVERTNTPVDQIDIPRGSRQASGKYMANVVLTIGETLRLGRSTSDRGEQGANPDTCVIKRRGTVAFCVEPAGWPENLKPHFVVDSIMYQGPMAITRYDDGIATNHHVIFNSDSFINIVDYYKLRYGDPTSVTSRGIAPMGKPRRGNPVAMWQSVDPQTNLVTTLEVRKFDDARGSFPDIKKGVIMLYHAWSSPIFPQLSTLELMVLKPQTTKAAGG